MHPGGSDAIEIIFRKQLGLYDFRSFDIIIVTFSFSRESTL